MTIRKIVLQIILVATAYVTASGQPAIPVVEENRVDLGVIPAVDWIYQIDAADGYIGIISDNRTKFHLFAPDGKPGFSSTTEGKGFFFVVSMQSGAGLVLVGKAISEGNYRYTGYNYEGQPVLGPLTTHRVVEIDPAGRFFYTVYDVGYEYFHPALFDSTGELVAEWLTTDVWDIKIVDSMHILLFDHHQTRILQYPDLKAEKIFMVSHEESYGKSSYALSTDGTAYAYVIRDKIFIVDLDTGRSFNIPNLMKNDIPLYPKMALSTGGVHLILTEAIDGRQAIRIFRRQKDVYINVVDTFNPPCPPGYHPLRNFALADSYCICTYFAKVDDRIRFVSYLFELPSGRTDSLAGRLFDGLATLDSSLKPADLTFRITTTGPDQASSRLLRIDRGERPRNFRLK